MDLRISFVSLTPSASPFHQIDGIQWYILVFDPIEESCSTINYKEDPTFVLVSLSLLSFPHFVVVPALKERWGIDMDYIGVILYGTI